MIEPIEYQTNNKELHVLTSNNFSLSFDKPLYLLILYPILYIIYRQLTYSNALFNFLLNVLTPKSVSGSHTHAATLTLLMFLSTSSIATICGINSGSRFNSRRVRSS